MIDPLRSEIDAAPGQVPEHEREARVEELLLGGLDHYFAGQYDLAINVWTRVLFLDRGHARARAYIERARSALSERQRKGEELIHTGADAFNRGESETARRLLISAVEQGAGTEEAMALLARLDRLAAAGVRQERRPDTIAPSIQGSVEAANGSTRAWITWTVGGAIAGAAAVAVLLGVYGLPRSSWVPFANSPAIRAAMRANDEPVPVPSASDVWLARAQAQKDRGHLRDALSALDAIRPGDKRSAEAERLRAEIQAALLAAGRAAAFGVSPAAQDSRRR
jgi:tetratricopeptide (TPR) repeat protein